LKHNKIAFFLLTLIIINFSVVVNAQQKNGFNLSESIIPIDQIKSGGPPKDGIPALTAPKFLSASEVDYLKTNDYVVGVSINGEHKAYPIKILNYHEIVNDLVGGTPIVVSYCPLCGSALVFSSVFRSSVLNFGVSGLLYNSDVLMYDKQTNSLWSQLTMQGISGKMKGQKLRFVNSEHTTWKDWNKRHPDTKALSLNTGYTRDYSRNPYADYPTSPSLYFPVANQSEELDIKEQVLGVEVDGKYKAYPFSELKKAENVFPDSLHSTKFTIQFNSSTRSAIVVSSSKPIVYITTYWFAWYAFHPDTEVYRAKKK